MLLPDFTPAAEGYVPLPYFTTHLFWCSLAVSGHSHSASVDGQISSRSSLRSAEKECTHWVIKNVPLNFCQ